MRECGYRLSGHAAAQKILGKGKEAKGPQAHSGFSGQRRLTLWGFSMCKRREACGEMMSDKIPEEL